MSSETPETPTPDIHADAVAILDTDGEPIQNGRRYKIRAADGSELGVGRLGGPFGSHFVFGMGPTNAGVPFFIQDTRWNSYYDVRIYTTIAGKSKCLTPVVETPLITVLTPEEYQNGNAQMVTGVKGTGNTVWIKMKNDGALHVSAVSDWELVNYITCAGDGYGFEVSFVRIPQ